MRLVRLPAFFQRGQPGAEVREGAERNRSFGQEAAHLRHPVESGPDELGRITGKQAEQGIRAGPRCREAFEKLPKRIELQRRSGVISDDGPEADCSASSKENDSMTRGAESQPRAGERDISA